jgi:hypothetical protein
MWYDTATPGLTKSAIRSSGDESAKRLLSKGSAYYVSGVSYASQRQHFGFFTPGFFRYRDARV